MTEKTALPDAYVPAIDTCVFTEEEKAAIDAALATEKPWNWKPGGDQEASITAAKVKIRELHKARHGDRCCYCRFPLHGGGHFIIDPEHILPKSLPAYRLLSFTVWNLGISCKRCNMQYKKAKIDFVVDPDTAEALQGSANYLLIHPNFDLYKEHISINLEMSDDSTIIKYTKRPGSAKGCYTFDYFNLQEREVGSFDEAQGFAASQDLSPGALEAQKLADQFGQ